MSNNKLKEDVPAMSAGAGNIAGIGVGPQGEPGVNMAVRRKKWKKDKQRSTSTQSPMRVPMDMVTGGMVSESFKPLDMDLWHTAQVLAKSEYPEHPTPDSTKFAINWYLEHGGEVASNVAKNESVDQLDKPTLSVVEIAKKHKVSSQQIEQQLKMGIKIESEHTSNTAMAREIALDHLAEKPDYYTRLKSVEEDLRKWFGTGKTGGVGGGGWDRYNTKGERIGKCGDAKDRGGKGEGKPKCLSREKAAQLRAQGGKQAIANAVKRKKAQDPVTNRKGTGSAPRPISNRIGESMLSEKNVPTNPELWSRAKAAAKKKFDVYPSAYANGWAAKWYKQKGGTWKTSKTESNTPHDREWGTDSLVSIYKQNTPGQLKEMLHTILDLAEASNDLRSCQSCGSDLTIREQTHGYQVCDACVAHYKHRQEQMIPDVRNIDEDCGCGGEITPVSNSIEEAEYNGRKVTLGKPFRTPSGPKKFSVYVTNDKGNVVKVNFGDPDMEIKRDDPKRRKAYRDRHNCSDPGPRWKANYWSCRMWSKKSVSKITEGGNVFVGADQQPLTKRILKNDIAPTVKWLESITKLDLTGPASPIDGLPSYWLGTTGRKTDSGDLDLMVDANKISKPELIARLEKWVSAQPDASTTKYVAKSGISVHFLTPIKGNPKNGFVQTDLMFVQNPKWSQFIISAGDPTSIFKGADRFVCISSLATFFGNKITQTDGMVNRETGALVSSDPNAIAKKLLSPKATAADLISVEKMLKALETDKDRDAKLEKFRQYLATDKRVTDRDKKLVVLDTPTETPTV